jgi:N,N'-diacetyllegionaminate synthase
MQNHTTIIAEAGVNHNGDLNLAKRLIDVAAEAGADFVKFQTFAADRLVTRAVGKAEYQISSTGTGESQHEMLRRLELTPEAHRILIDHCRSRRIGFLSTGFDIESVDLLVKLGLEYIKVPSGEITNLPYLRHIGRLGKQVILSTGMATLNEVGSAIEVLERAGTSRKRMTVLHCTTEYPAPMVDVNLRAMLTIRDAFGVAVGYSDHTSGIEVATAAVALGATVVEKHFTLDTSLPGPDHKASLVPDQLKALVAAIRNVETALGDGIKRPRPSEAKNKQVVRKSLVAAKPIRAGEAFTGDNIAVKRPGTGISPMRWDEILGQRATRNYVADELIEP